MGILKRGGDLFTRASTRLLICLTTAGPQPDYIVDYDHPEMARQSWWACRHPQQSPR